MRVLGGFSACGPVGLPLLLLSITLMAVAVERGLFWWSWWKLPLAQRRSRLRDRRALAFAEPVLEAVVVLAPLLGVFGTVLALMRLLQSLGLQQSSLLGSGELLVSTAFGLTLALAALLLLLLNRGLRRWQRFALALPQP